MYLILDGQYLTLKNKEEVMINKEELPLTDLHLYDKNNEIEICGSLISNNFYISLSLEEEFKGYFFK